MLTIPGIFAGSFVVGTKSHDVVLRFPGYSHVLAAVTAAIFLDSTFIKSLRGERCYAYDVYK